MTDKPAKRQRRQHLKNVRQVNKGRSSTGRKQANAQAATINGGNVMVSLGLVVTSAIVLLFLASVVFQYGFNSSSGESTPVKPAKTQQNTAAMPPLERSTVEVRVLNGCGVPGAGRLMTNRLRDLGFDVVMADNADHFGYEHTLVVDHTDRPEVGRTVAAALGCGQLSAMHDEMAMAHVTVVLGQDWENFLEHPDTTAAAEKDWIDRVGGKVRHLLEN